MSENPEVLEKSLTRALAGGPRSDFIAELVVQPMYSLASIINAEYFEALARRRAVLSRTLHWSILRMSIGSPQRLAVMCRGHLSALLVKKLICFQSERDVKRELKHAISILSRRHFVGLKDRAATCISTLQ